MALSQRNWVPMILLSLIGVAGLLALHRDLPGRRGLPRPDGRAGPAGGEPGHGLYLIPVAGVGLSAAFFGGDPLTAARVPGGLIMLLGVILTRVALDRAARVPV